ncbi:hypothetical protein GCM10010448_42870 [Streptomyces glomeratus]|uniref:Uncharacterized protein n=1 Tax=Streptomyces glomeratus TaxID=284452 RepID=A0ABP6LQF4_9ACTN
MHLMPGRVLVHGQQRHPRRLRLGDRPVRAAYDDARHPGLRGGPGQRPGGRGPHAHRQQQRSRRPGRQSAGVVQQRLGDGRAEAGRRGEQPDGGLADDIQQVAEGAGVRGPLARIDCGSGRLENLIRNLGRVWPPAQRGVCHGLARLDS